MDGLTPGSDSDMPAGSSVYFTCFLVTQPCLASLPSASRGYEWNGTAWVDLKSGILVSFIRSFIVLTALGISSSTS